MQQLMDRQQHELNKLLLDNIQPYLGCTDISIIALGTALAAQAAKGSIPQWVDKQQVNYLFSEVKPEDVISITLQMNESLFKNSHATAIPNAGGHYGIHKSAALGLFTDPGKKLNLFSNLGSDHIEKMEKITEKAEITVETVNKPACNLFLYVRVAIRGEKGEITGESRLENSYTRVVSLKRNNETLYNLNTGKVPDIDDMKVIFDIPNLMQALEHLPEEVYQKLEETVALNTGAYEYGLENAPGLGIGSKLNNMMLRSIIGNGIANEAASKTAAAEDVRMGGEDVPAMGIAGSGSHGIAASIPIIAVAERMGKDRKILLQSIALSFWLTQKMNDLIGHLSAPCGCVIKSGTGATAGIAYYMGGTAFQIEQAINNYIISTAGVICDGGKTTCAIKLASGATNAVQSAFLALEGVNLTNESGGIVREELQKNIENLVLVSKSMQGVDQVIVDILKSY
ncbi:MAG: L-serine ammonia-lyase, iron-sulfur-dependent, subunit alpha [Candidatus Odinarchaeota archaeon]